jgi:hypothetical protein
MKFSNNVLYSMFDFLCTETVFLSVSLVNKLFYNKTKNYIKVAGTVQIKDSNYSIMPVFPLVSIMDLRLTNSNSQIHIALPVKLERITISGIYNQLGFTQYPANLTSIKISIKNSNSNNIKNNFNPSFESGNLKKVKISGFGIRFSDIINVFKNKALEELNIFLTGNDSIPVELISSLNSLRKLKMYRGIDSVDNIQVISYLKRLTDLKLYASVFNYPEIIADVINNLPNLVAIGFYPCVNYSTTGVLDCFLNSTRNTQIQRFAFTIFMSVEEQKSGKFIESISKIFIKYPSLESLKMKLMNLKDEYLPSAVEGIIRLCLDHKSIYKFNGIPIKYLESRRVASIELCEDLINDYNVPPAQKSSNLTSGILVHYNSYLNDLYELRIKSLKSPIMNIYIPKLLSKITRLGFFSDALYHYKIPKFAFLIVFNLISSHKEVKALKFEKAYNDHVFFNIMQNSQYVEFFEGHINDLYLDVFLKMNLNTIVLNMMGKKLKFSNILLLISKTGITSFCIKDTNLLLDSNPDQQIVYSLETLKLINFGFGTQDCMMSMSRVILNSPFLRVLELRLRDFYESSIYFFTLIKNLRSLEVFHLSLVTNIRINEIECFLDNLKDLLKTLKGIKDFSLSIYTNDREPNKMNLIYNFIKEYAKSTPKIERLNGIDSNLFNINWFSSHYF